MRGMRERIRAARGAGGPTAAPPRPVSVTLRGTGHPPNAAAERARGVPRIGAAV